MTSVTEVPSVLSCALLGVYGSGARPPFRPRDGPQAVRMVQSKAEDVDGYLAEVPEERRNALRGLRLMCRQELTGFGEIMAYAMPAYERDGVTEVAFASQKNYVSFYLPRTDVRTAFEERLAGQDMGNLPALPQAGEHRLRPGARPVGGHRGPAGHGPLTGWPLGGTPVGVPPPRGPGRTPRRPAPARRRQERRGAGRPGGGPSLSGSARMPAPVPGTRPVRRSGPGSARPSSATASRNDPSAPRPR